MTSYHKSMSAFLCSLLLSSICLTSLVESSNTGGITVDLFHRDSRHSPSYDPSNTRFQRLRSAFDRAFSRKSSLMASRSTSTSTDSVDAPISPAGGEYLMKIKIGTPPVEQLGIADTGSDLTWTQCKPCTHCYKQTLPLFDPSRTSSYRPVSCESEQCAASGTASCDGNNSCQYQVSYGDRSYSFGELAVETLTFDGGVSFPKVAFGCGHDNEGTFGQTGSGIVGLGGGSISIINQLQSSIGGKFSYCLALLNSNATSKISFGSSAVVAGPNVVSTPLVRKSPDTFYYLTLEGVSVGTERVDYNTAAGEGNIIIDSGTTLTFVPSELYDGVESALEKAMTGNRVEDPRGMFKMCYEMGGDGGISSPPVTAHFKGADLVLPEESIFVEVEQGISCLTLVASQDLAIFGNLHQMNYHIGYDLVKREVSFQPTDCSKPQ
ncbi:aspartic proteinase CDR1-like [Salvia miltiorrhiza]|uniref:aspartic proteinase CDR1-like n=1 Tax=Salvia miltiorrhiza TaxID=226208 RepID=UPI0025AC7169|nr:aspartic proteinase CDR1-like [Salvia miltiorrhiza]